MSSWTFEEVYTKDNIYIEYFWDKYAPHYWVLVGKKGSDGLVYTIWKNSYATIDSAKRSFKRQVKKYEN